MAGENQDLPTGTPVDSSVLEHLERARSLHENHRGCGGWGWGGSYSLHLEAGGRNRGAILDTLTTQDPLESGFGHNLQGEEAPTLHPAIACCVHEPIGCHWNPALSPLRLEPGFQSMANACGGAMEASSLRFLYCLLSLLGGTARIDSQEGRCL